jgi:hypothetical protein
MARTGGTKRGPPTPATGERADLNPEMEKRRKTYRDAAEGGLVLWVKKETEEGDKIDITDSEIEKIYKRVDQHGKKVWVEQERTMMVAKFGVTQGMVRMALEDAWSKTEVSKALVGIPSSFKIYDQVEVPVFKRFTVWVPSRRETPESFHRWALKMYKLKQEDMKVYAVIEKEGGNTLALGLSDKAVEAFQPRGMRIFIGAGCYELKDWGARKDGGGRTTGGATAEQPRDVEMEGPPKTT